MRIFLDSNALDKIIDGSISGLLYSTQGISLVTFEQCVFECKNAVKRRFWDRKFIASILSGKDADKKYSATVYEKMAYEIAHDLLEILDLSDLEKKDLRKILNRLNLHFEFGIAEEYECIEIPRTDPVGILKNFYKLLKIRLRASFREIDAILCTQAVEVILYDKVFGDRLANAEFRRMLEDSYLPYKDVELVFAALQLKSDVFVTDDGKKNGGILQDRLTLGFNYPIHFRTVEEFIEIGRTAVCNQTQNHTAHIRHHSL